jgi:anthranilate phosphoribosyltransferase
MNKCIEKLHNIPSFSQPDAHQLMLDIASNVFSEEEIKNILLFYNKRFPTVHEFLGFRNALLELSIPIVFDEPVMDVCGTGGDGKNTFNISTLAAFICAGAGVKVAKHGNYAFSSVSGSSNVLELLGIKFTNNEGLLKKGLDEANIAILHAPFFHPALKAIGPIRQSLGVRTFFNLLGPLVNPCRPKFQITGVYNAEIGQFYQRVLQNSNSEFNIIFAQDGYDEISLTSNIDVWTSTTNYELPFTQFVEKAFFFEDIEGGNTKEAAAKIFLDIIEGNGTKAQNEVCIANAAIGISLYKKIPLDVAISEARISIEYGKAFESFQKLKSIYQI